MDGNPTLLGEVPGESTSVTTFLVMGLLVWDALQ